MKAFSLLVILVFSFSARAELTTTVADSFDHDEVVIENQWTDNVNWEEPSFSPPKPQRDIAYLKEIDASSIDTDWQGDLEVLKEIPYSYPDLSRLTIQMRTLKDFQPDDVVDED